MEKIDILLWIVAGGFAVTFSLMKMIFNEVKLTRSDFKEDIKSVKEEIGSVKEQVIDIDRRLCRIEGALSAKDCCVLKDDKQLKKAE